jgi:Alkylmercury lyase
MPTSDSLERDVRLHIFEQLIETSSAPSPADAAHALGCSEADAEAAFHALEAGRFLVLQPGTTTVWMAMPFSNIPTSFTVISGGRAYYATCAWTAFGIAAVLGTDARVFTTCPDCGGALERKIASGAITDPRGVVHFAVPARQWWDDIGFTCATILLFASEAHVDRWCAREAVPRGELLGLEQTLELARVCFSGRLDRNWRRPTASETSAAFASIGLEGEFWRLNP